MLTFYETVQFYLIHKERGFVVGVKVLLWLWVKCENLLCRIISNVIFMCFFLLNEFEIFVCKIKDYPITNHKLGFSL